MNYQARCLFSQHFHCPSWYFPLLSLPPTIKQSNLPDLQHTNGTVLRNLLQKDNDDMRTLPPMPRTKQFIEKIAVRLVRAFA